MISAASKGKHVREASPAFQFYVDAFQTDETIGLMRLAEVGLLTLLLCRCWHDQSIPDDVDKIAALTRSEAKKYWPTVRACFTESADEPGRLRHSELDLQRARQASFRERQSLSGAIGAQRRWHSDPMRDPNGVAITTPLGSDSSHKHVDDDVVIDIIQRLRNLGVDEAAAKNLASQTPEECLRQLDYIDRRRRVKDKSGYIVSAIRGSYAPPPEVAKSHRRPEPRPDPIPKDRKPTKIGSEALIHIGQLIGVPVDERRAAS